MSTLAQENILILSLPRHDGAYNSTPWQIATLLADDNHVFFADHPYTFLEAIREFRTVAIRKRFKAYFDWRPERKNGIDVLYLPFVWPVNFLPKGKLYNFFSRQNHQIISKRINKILQNLEVTELVYINSFDFYFQALDQYLKPHVKLTVYHCIDPMVKAFTLKHGAYLENSLAHHADVVISTAPALQRKFSALGTSKGYLVPNGVDVRHFSKPQMNRRVSAERTQPKTIGYLGNIERRIDYTLLMKCIDLLPDWRLILAGPVEKKYVPAEMFDHPQITFTEAIPYQEAPVVMHSFDVAVIPFLCDEVSAGIYPLKMFEYLAAGKPVVSTNFNAEVLLPLAEFVACASTPNDFARRITEAYDEDSEGLVQERMSLASRNTWKDRAERFGTIVKDELEKKKNHVR